MEPESNQVSSTSGIRFIASPLLAHGNVISSTMCLCKSVTFSPLAFSNSATDPNTRYFLHSSHCHTGITLAQNRWREIDQSRAPSSHLPNLPSLMCSGDQLIFLASLMALSFTSVTFTNNEDVA